MTTIAIVGVGFLGSWYSQLLMKLAFSQEMDMKLVFIDSDTWEMRNAANQQVSLMDAKVEGPKVATFEAMAKNDYGFQAEGHQVRLIMDNLHLLHGADLVVDCVDNIPTRQLLHNYGLISKTPIMHMGIAKKGEGAVNWTTSKISTFPYTVQAVAGRVLVDDDGKNEPPCEMFKYLFNGMKVVEAGVKATAFFFARDPWESSKNLITQAIKSLGLSPEDTEETINVFVGDMGDRFEMDGLITCWATSGNGIEVRTDPTTLIEGFFPIVE